MKVRAVRTVRRSLFARTTSTDRLIKFIDFSLLFGLLAQQSVVFSFRFGNDGSSMVVTMADAERVLDTASKTRLCRRDPELLLEIFMENCGAGETNRQGRQSDGQTNK